ncbi:hypothetical protein LCGC14_0681520 [marine sediment metagenome]|uniref:Uncharacterized protein n=1 Tax=marine sediment metagenome TaxID=412755 RepID=A0A0F9R8C0_9ZZZZ
MNIWIPLVCIVITVGLLGILAYLLILLKVINQLTETNKQLLIVVAGKDDKPESLRALVASNKPPKKVLPGIVDKKKEKESENVDYKMTIGVR